MYSRFFLCYEHETMSDLWKMSKKIATLLSNTAEEKKEYYFKRNDRNSKTFDPLT